MSIETAIKQALERDVHKVAFRVQIEENKKFSKRMENAGVTTRKQSFSIPLMERIVKAD